MSDDDLAATLATEAGRLLLDVRREFADASVDDRKAAGDQRSHDFLMAALAAERPDDAVLSEEGADDPIRLSSRRVWIVDPLDGTREFSEPGRDDWAVHVALWQDGELVAGAVALPAQGSPLATPTVATPPAAPQHPGSWCREPGHRTSRCRCANGWTAPWSKWVRRERKSRPWCRGLRRCLRPRRRAVRMGLGGPGGRRTGRGPAHLPHRRLAAALQPVQPEAARSGGVPTGVRRGGAGRHPVAPDPASTVAVAESPACGCQRRPSTRSAP